MKLNKFNQIIIKYSKTNVFNNIVDNATQDELIEYFYDKYACEEDEKFLRMFKRNLRMYVKQYNKLLRNENIDFDPMVTRYLEQQNITKGSNTLQRNRNDEHRDNESKQNNIITNTDNSYSDNRNQNQRETSSAHSDENGSVNLTTQNNGGSTDTDRHKDINAQFAQANMGNLSINPDVVDVNYATQSNNAKDIRDNTHNDTTTERGTNGLTINGTGQVDTQLNRQDVGTSNGKSVTTDNTEKEKNGTLSSAINETSKMDGQETIQKTGRENYSPAQLLEAARNYIATTNSFIWLVSKLDKCFIGNFRYENEEDVW